MHTIDGGEKRTRMRQRELITMGRTILDVYGNQVGCGLEDTSSFSKYVGGCPANIAIGAARLGVRVAHVARVGDDHHGRFLRAQLAREGVDVSHVRTDPRRLTGVAFLGLRDRDTFPLLHYRDDCADMALTPEDYAADFIATAKALLVSGSHVTTATAAANLMHATRLARSVDTQVIFDIDYRPVFWQLVAKDLGESRYVSSAAATTATQQVIPYADLVVGTEEEIQLAGGVTDTQQALRHLRALTSAPLVMKRGARGCLVFPAAIPARLDDALQGPGFPVEVFNLVGAGDGFMAGFLSGWLRDLDWEACCRRGNACGALVVSRHGCSPASPTAAELDWYLEHATRESRLHNLQALERVHRATTRRARPIPAVLIDCSASACALPDGGSRSRAAFAALAATVVLRHAVCGLPVGIAVEGAGSEDALYTIGAGSDWVVRAIDVPGTEPLTFLGDKTAAVLLRHWPQQQIVKCRVPLAVAEAAVLRNERLRELQLAVEMWGHELLLAPEGIDDVSAAGALADELLEIGVAPDWWSLPASLSPAATTHSTQFLLRRTPHCRGIVLAADESAAHASIGQVVRLVPPPESMALWAAERLSDEALLADIELVLESALRLGGRA
jgi:5-dehydro-2-deoxygluconokinase